MSETMPDPEEITVTLMPEPDEVDDGEIDPDDDYREGGSPTATATGTEGDEHAC